MVYICCLVDGDVNQQSNCMDVCVRGPFPLKLDFISPPRAILIIVKYETGKYHNNIKW